MKTPDSIAVDRALPLDRKVPNEETRRAMAEVDEIVQRRAEHFATADEPLEELEDDHPQPESEPKVPNAETRRAMAECEEMMRRGTARFANAEEMFAELEQHGSAVVAVPREGRPVLTAAEVEETSAGLRSGARSASGTQGVE